MFDPGVRVEKLEAALRSARECVSERHKLVEFLVELLADARELAGPDFRPLEAHAWLEARALRVSREGERAGECRPLPWEVLSQAARDLREGKAP